MHNVYRGGFNGNICCTYSIGFDWDIVSSGVAGWCTGLIAIWCTFPGGERTKRCKNQIEPLGHYLKRVTVPLKPYFFPERDTISH